VVIIRLCFHDFWFQAGYKCNDFAALQHRHFKPVEREILLPSAYLRSVIDSRCWVAAKLRRGSIFGRAARGRADTKARGVNFGRKPTLTLHQQKEARKRLEAGGTLRSVARSHKLSQSTISRLQRQARAILGGAPLRLPLVGLCKSTLEFLGGPKNVSTQLGIDVLAQPDIIPRHLTVSNFLDHTINLA